MQLIILDDMSLKRRGAMKAFDAESVYRKIIWHYSWNSSPSLRFNLNERNSFGHPDTLYRLELDNPQCTDAFLILLAVKIVILC